MANRVLQKLEITWEKWGASSKQTSRDYRCKKFYSIFSTVDHSRFCTKEHKVLKTLWGKV